MIKGDCYYLTRLSSGLVNTDFNGILSRFQAVKYEVQTAFRLSRMGFYYKAYCLIKEIAADLSVFW